MLKYMGLADEVKKNEEIIETTEKDERIDKIYSLMQESEKKDIISQRSEAFKFLDQAFFLYKEVLKEKGKSYFHKKYSDIPARMNLLVDRLTEYNT